MPYSSAQGKSWITDRVAARRPASLLDVGAGAGTYARLLRPRLPGCWMIGVEVFAPYVDRFDLPRLYDELVIGDARSCPLPEVDVVILGDVIEHLELDDGLALWRRARDLASGAVYLSLPIIEWPQGEQFGNHHEAHLHTWTHEQVLELPGITAFQTTDQIGVYEAASTEHR